MIPSIHLTSVELLCSTLNLILKRAPAFSGIMFSVGLPTSTVVISKFEG